MKKSKEKQIGSAVDSRILHLFKAEILRKPGQLRGAFKLELRKALKERTDKLRDEFDESDGSD